MEDVTTTVTTLLGVSSAAVTLDMSWMMMDLPAMVSGESCWCYLCIKQKHGYDAHTLFSSLQILMSVLEVLTTVIGMPTALTLLETTTVPVMRDTKAVALRAIAIVCM